MAENIIPHHPEIGLNHRIQKNGHKPLLIWFVGLSGSGKSTIASALEEKLFNESVKTYILDGDNIRSGLNNDLDFSDESRKENLRRIAEVSKLFIDAGTVVMTAFITPFAEERKNAKELIGADNYFEIFVDCPLEICEKRDVKGLYAKARNGKIKNFTGIDSPFETPKNADLVIESHKITIESAVSEIYRLIKERIKL